MFDCLILLRDVIAPRFLHLLVEERPAITDPQPLVVCDTDGDGIAVFNLTSAEPDILQGLTGGPYVVSLLYRHGHD